MNDDRRQHRQPVALGRRQARIIGVFDFQCPLALTADVYGLDFVGIGALVQPRRIGRIPGVIVIDGFGRFAKVSHGALHFVAQVACRRRRQLLSVKQEAIGQGIIRCADVKQLKAEVVRVSHPGRMIRADKLAAGFHGFSWDKVAQRENPAADAIARLEDRHVVTQRRQLVGARQPGQTTAGDEDARRSAGGASMAPDQVAYQ